MRHLLDTYIRAEESEELSAFDDLTLVQLIVERGDAAVDALPEGIRKNSEAIAETIENNVRRLIIDETAVNPKYYEKMSKLLDALILQRKQASMDYKAYLARLVELTKSVSSPETQSSYPARINNSTLRALYDNLDEVPVSAAQESSSGYGSGDVMNAREAKALTVDASIRRVKKADWRGNRFKEREIRNAIKSQLNDEGFVNTIFEIVKAQSDY